MPKWSYTIPLLIPLLKELKKVNKVLILLTNCEKSTFTLLNSIGIKYIKIKMISSKDSVLGFKRISDILKYRIFFQKIINNFKPDFFLSLDGKRFYDKIIVRLCNKKQIPTLSIQWSFSLYQEDYNKQREEIKKRGNRNRSFVSNFKEKGNLDSIKQSTYFYKELIKKNIPKLIVHFLINVRELIIRNLIMRPLGIAYYNFGRSLGGGECIKMAVIGDHYVDQFNNQGVPKEKIIVCGLLEHDKLYLIETDLKLKEQYINEVYSDFGILRNKKIIFWATRPSYEDGFSEVDSKNEVLSILEPLLKRKENFEIIITLHPRTDEKRFRDWLPKNDRIHLIKKYDNNKLLMACSLFVSSYSTVVLGALALDKLILTYNLLKIPGGDIFGEQVGGVAHVKKANKVPEVLDNLLSNETYKNKLRVEMENVRNNYMKFDGKVVERIIALISNMVVEKEQYFKEFRALYKKINKNPELKNIYYLFKDHRI